MKITRGNDNSIYAVFCDEDAASKHAFFFRTVLRRRMCCLGGYYNAWKLI